MHSSTRRDHIMQQISGMIVRFRYVLFLLFTIACIYCVLSVNKVKVNSDLTHFLSESTETRQGLNIMEDEFITYGTANVMISNITYEKALSLAEEVRTIPHVAELAFDDTEAHYVNAAALFSVTFDGTETDPDAIKAMEQIRVLLAEYDTYISTTVGNALLQDLGEEMLRVLIVCMIVVMIVLLLTSRSYFEVFIYLIVFMVAAILNMGTNFWLGEISAVTNTVAVILQLALAIDYAIIFAHRYQDAISRQSGEKKAVIEALSGAIIEISASSLTTVAGLAALTLMQFKMGYDLGVVLAKGIVCSMLTVFLLMPSLILLFPGALRVTAHRDLVPEIKGWSRFLARSKVLFIVIFVLLIPAAIHLSGRAEYAFDDSGISEIIPSESRTASRKITETFYHDTLIMLIVPSGNYDGEKAILSEVSDLPLINSVQGLASIEVEEGHVLTDLYTPRMFSKLLGISYEKAVLIYTAYGVEHQDFTTIFGDAEDYSVPLVNMFLYVFEKIDQGIVTLEDDQQEMLDSLRGSLERGVEQLIGTEHDRMLIYADVPNEGAESEQLVEDLRAIAEQYYEEGSVVLVGNVTCAKDLAASYTSDKRLISILSILFVFIILLFTFKSFAASVILILVIQGSIWINFALSYLMGVRSCFVTPMIITAIQMGSTIDYAIVVYNRYRIARETLPKRPAMELAVRESFPTIMTSGIIMTVAGLLVAFMISDVYVGHIGLGVGRGALISILLVLSVLPQLLVLMDGLIRKTTFSIKLKEDIE